MSHSEAWADIQPTIRTPINHKGQSNQDTITKTIIDMLDVAKMQSEISSTMIPFFFSRIDSILDYLVRTEIIQTQKQSIYFREKIMKILEVPEVGIHIELHDFFKKNYSYRDRFSLSLKLIKEKVQQWKTFDQALHDCWVTRDKKFFSYDLTTLMKYTRLIKSYSIEKYGEIPFKK